MNACERLFSAGIEREGVGERKFPVEENIKNRGFLKRSRATSSIAKRPAEGTTIKNCSDIIGTVFLIRKKD